MAIAFGAIGSKGIGTTTAACGYPASPGAGDMAIAHLDTYTSGVSSLSAEAGWSQLGPATGGTGTANDNHTSRIGAHYRELTGSESGSVTFDQVGGGGLVGLITRYTKDAGEIWLPPVWVAGTDDAHGPDRSVTSAAISLEPGDMVTTVIAVDTDSAIVMGSLAMSAPGITFDTPSRRSPLSVGATGGTDGNVDVVDALVLSGSGSVAITLSFNTTTNQCGPIGFIRLRVGTPGPSEDAYWGVRI